MNDFMSDWNGCPKSLSVAFTLNFADCSWYIHHEGDRACASRPVRQPDRRQVLGDHKVGQRISHFHYFNSSCSATSMALMPPDRSRARPPICSSRGSRSTTIRPLEGNMCQGWEHRIEWFYPGLHQYMGNSGSPRRSRARHHGLCEKWRLRSNLPPRQLRLRTEWRRQQLGQGALHWGGDINK